MTGDVVTPAGWAETALSVSDSSNVKLEDGVLNSTSHYAVVSVVHALREQTYRGPR